MSTDLAVLPSTKQFLAGLLCILTAAHGAMAQVGAVSQRSFVIRVLQGNNAYHSIGTHTGALTVIEVRDATAGPVEGASVTFELPDNGASGSFGTGGRTLEVRTTSQGRAAATGFVPNSTAGTFALKVTASKAGQTETATVWQTNSWDRFDEGLPASRGLWKWLLVGGVAGGATGLTLLLRNGGNQQRPGWTPGSPVIGGPR